MGSPFSLYMCDEGRPSLFLFIITRKEKMAAPPLIYYTCMHYVYILCRCPVCRTRHLWWIKERSDGGHTGMIGKKGCVMESYIGGVDRFCLPKIGFAIYKTKKKPNVLNKRDWIRKAFCIHSLKLRGELKFWIEIKWTTFFLFWPCFTGPSKKLVCRWMWEASMTIRYTLYRVFTWRVELVFSLLFVCLLYFFSDKLVWSVGYLSVTVTVLYQKVYVSTCHQWLMKPSWRRTSIFFYRCRVSVYP
jgi:hypothetical protein